MKSIKNGGHIVNGCQICSHKKLEPVLSLGHHPVVQEYRTPKTLHEREDTYPLNLVRCPNCGLLQLDYIVDPKIVFPRHYPYRSGLTNMLIRNFQSLADTFEKNYSIKKGDLVVDIGSNDGTLLKPFKQKGMRVLGVEPTDAAKDAKKNGITTIQDYFNRTVSQNIVKKYGKARLVTATNVFAHIDNAVVLAQNIAALLDKDGIFISESQYLMDIFEKLEFDTIYHEHLRFYSLKPLVKLFSLSGMSMIDAERISAAGGSIRVYAKKGKHAMSDRAKKLIVEEEKAGLYDAKELSAFANHAITAKHKLLALLLKCKKEGARIVGLTSSARSNTLLNFTKITNDILDYTCEKNGSPKIGLFTPGMHIPVVDEAQLLKDQPEYALVLSWHIGMELIKKTKEAGFKGKFIIPLPKPQIVK